MKTVTTQNAAANDHTYCVQTKTGLSQEDVLNNAILELVEKKHIPTDSLNRFNQLRQQLLDWIAYELAQTPQTPKHNVWPHWGWQYFINEPDFRIGLLRVYKHNAIPIHDHPGASGVLFVLNGNLTLNDYQLQGAGINKMKLADLTLLDQQTIKKNEYTLITPENGNIHSLSTESDTCIILDILLIPYDEKQRTWYTPVTTDIQSGQSFSAFCVNKNRT